MPTQSLETTVGEVKGKVETMATNFGEFKKEVREHLARIEGLITANNKQHSDDMNLALSDFVRKEQFRPVQAIVYGLVTIILVAVVGAIVGLVVIK